MSSNQLTSLAASNTQSGRNASSVQTPPSTQAQSNVGRPNRLYSLICHEEDDPEVVEDTARPSALPTVCRMVSSTWACLTEGQQPHPSVLTVQTNATDPESVLNQMGYTGFQGLVKEEVDDSIHKSAESIIQLSRARMPFDDLNPDNICLRGPSESEQRKLDESHTTCSVYSAPEDVSKGYWLSETTGGTLPETTGSTRGRNQLDFLSERLSGLILIDDTTTPQPGSVEDAPSALLSPSTDDRGTATHDKFRFKLSAACKSMKAKLRRKRDRNANA